METKRRKRSKSSQEIQRESRISEYHGASLLPTLPCSVPPARGGRWWWRFSCSVVSDSENLGTVASRLLCPWDFPGNDTGMGCHFLLQGNLLTQGLNQGLLHCRHSPALQADSLLTEPLGKPKEVGGEGVGARDRQAAQVLHSGFVVPGVCYASPSHVTKA